MRIYAKLMIGLVLLSSFLPILGFKCGSEEDKVIVSSRLLGG